MRHTFAKVEAMTILDTILQSSSLLQGFTQPRTVYTPTWTATNTAPSIGNGILSGRYVNLGKTGFLQIYTKIGSTTNPGAGDYNWSLPSSWVAATNSVGPVVIGGAWIMGSGTSYCGAVCVNSADTKVFAVTSESTNLVGSYSPVGALVAGDVLLLQATMELT